MTRWFYSDPLEAAYMQKHYGMRFISEVIDDAEVIPHDAMFHPTLSEDESELVADGDLHNAVCLTCIEPYDKLYVHPDSMHLLDPQPGDLVQNVVNKRTWILQTGDFIKDPNPNVITITEDPDAIRILQRNGKHFFHPQSA